eukprot:1869713-Rhodomonas_salina.2
MAPPYDTWPESVAQPRSSTPPDSVASAPTILRHPPKVPLSLSSIDTPPEATTAEASSRYSTPPSLVAEHCSSVTALQHRCPARARGVASPHLHAVRQEDAAATQIQAATLHSAVVLHHDVAVRGQRCRADQVDRTPVAAGRAALHRHVVVRLYAGPAQVERTSRAARRAIRHCHLVVRLQAAVARQHSSPAQRCRAAPQRHPLRQHGSACGEQPQAPPVRTTAAVEKLHSSAGHQRGSSGIHHTSIAAGRAVPQRHVNCSTLGRRRARRCAAVQRDVVGQDHVAVKHPRAAAEPARRTVADHHALARRQRRLGKVQRAAMRRRRAACDRHRVGQLDDTARTCVDGAATAQGGAAEERAAAHRHVRVLSQHAPPADRRASHQRQPDQRQTRSLHAEVPARPLTVQHHLPSAALHRHVPCHSHAARPRVGAGRQHKGRPARCLLDLSLQVVPRGQQDRAVCAVVERDALLLGDGVGRAGRTGAVRGVEVSVARPLAVIEAEKDRVARAWGAGVAHRSRDLQKRAQLTVQAGSTRIASGGGGVLSGCARRTRSVAHFALVASEAARFTGTAVWPRVSCIAKAAALRL